MQLPLHSPHPCVRVVRLRKLSVSSTQHTRHVRAHTRACTHTSVRAHTHVRMHEIEFQNQWKIKVIVAVERTRTVDAFRPRVDVAASSDQCAGSSARRLPVVVFRRLKCYPDQNGRKCRAHRWQPVQCCRRAAKIKSAVAVPWMTTSATNVRLVSAV